MEGVAWMGKWPGWSRRRWRSSECCREDGDGAVDMGSRVGSGHGRAPTWEEPALEDGARWINRGEEVKRWRQGERNS